MDPLSDVLLLHRPRSSISAGLEAGGAWSLRFEAPDGIKFNAVMRGSCWVVVDGDEEPLHIAVGDCFLLTRRRPFVLASDLALEPDDAGPIYETARHGIATCNGGGDFFLIGGRFSFAGDHAERLFGTLPPVVVVREVSDQASVLRWALDQLAKELREPQPGGFLVSEHLAHIMLVQVLRLHLAGHSDPGTGWLQALADDRIGPVIGAIHADPARRWRLEELASLASMSRSTFAQRFKQTAGSAPLEYLARWRMLMAGERLRNTNDTLAAIAVSVGYESEGAFSTAFKRVMRCSPRQYRRSAQPAVSRCAGEASIQPVSSRPSRIAGVPGPYE